MGKIGKNLANLLRKTAFVSSIAVPLVFSGCEPEEPEPPITKSIEQSVALNNDIEIKYSATLSNVDKAELNVKREGVLISTKEINDVNQSGADYQNTFTYAKDGITKGNYEFTLTSDNLEKKNSVEIPNYKPSMNASGLNLNLDENSEINVTLPNTPDKIFDKNPEDNPVSYVNAKSLDGKTQLTLNGNNLNIKALSNYTGAYQFELEYGSTTGGLEKKTLQGEIIESTGPKINYLLRPNINKDLNWYGSGDADGNNQSLNENDLSRLTEVANGTYSNDNDKRLRDRCDVNGDSYVNLLDVQILRNKLNGSIPRLPGDWDKLPTRAEQEDWAKKMFDIDKTNTTAFPGGDCNQFTDQTFINFYGVSSTDIPKFLEVYPYDFTNNGRFNLPLLEVIILDYDSEGKLVGGHAMNIFIFDNPSIYENICPVEPQRDHINVQPGEDYFIGMNSKFYIRGPPIFGAIDAENGKKDISMNWYVKYDIKDKIPNLIWINPDLINRDGK